MTAAPPRPLDQRRRDTLARFEADIDTWVATADAGGTATLVPLSYLWDGTTFTLATREDSPTGRNLTTSGRARLAIGTTRDVVLVDGTVETMTLETVPGELADAFGARHWDARLSRHRYAYYRVTPVRVQAWREENELVGRTIMRDGRWLA
jgi:hypothetical protein